MEGVEDVRKRKNDMLNVHSYKQTLRCIFHMALMLQPLTLTHSHSMHGPMSAADRRILSEARTKICVRESNILCAK